MEYVSTYSDILNRKIIFFLGEYLEAAAADSVLAPSADELNFRGCSTSNTEPSRPSKNSRKFSSDIFKELPGIELRLEVSCGWHSKLFASENLLLLWKTDIKNETQVSAKSEMDPTCQCEGV